MIEAGAKLGAFRLARRARKGLISILTYHSFTDDERRGTGTYSFLYRYSVSVRQFDLHLSLLQRVTKVLSPDEFLAILDGAAPPEHGALITIDDALQSAFHLALPVLAARKLPALLFAPTAGVEGASAALDGSQWTEWLAALVLTDTIGIRRAWSKLRESAPGLPLRPSRHDMGVLQDLTMAAWSLSPQARDGLVSDVWRLVGREPRWEDLRYSHDLGTILQVMTWEQLREASRGPVEVGSHSITHARLASLAEPDLVREIVVSASKIRENLGRPCRFFSVPYGSAGDCHPQQERVLAVAGYQAAFTEETGPCGAPLRRFRIPRTGIGTRCSVGRLEFYLSGPRTLVRKLDPDDAAY